MWTESIWGMLDCEENRARQIVIKPTHVTSIDGAKLIEHARHRLPTQLVVESFAHNY